MKKLYFYFTSLILIFSGTLFSQNYSGGSGTSNDPFLISNKNDLLYLSNNYTTGIIYFEQTSDIVFDAADFQAGGIAYNSGAGFKPIAEGSNFNGFYNGKNHKIKNVSLNRTANNPNGLFYELNAAIINNLILENCSFEISAPSNGEVGFLAGKITNGSKIENVDVINSTVTFNSVDDYDDSKAGGIVGVSENNSIIEDCFGNGIIIYANDYGETYFGGICCTANSTTIRRCKAQNLSISNSSGSGSGNRIGGIAANVINGTIEHCYAELNTNLNAMLGGIAAYIINSNILNTKAYVNCVNWDLSGGLIGYANGGNFISNSSSSGSLSGTADFGAGGLIGSVTGSTISKCYSSVNITILQAASTWTPSAAGLCLSLTGSICEESFCTGNIGFAPGAAYHTMAGAIGYVEQNSVVRNCYSRGNVIGVPENEFTFRINGGFIGLIESGSTVTNCYSTGIVINDNNGGFIQVNAGCVVSNCYWDTQSSLTTNSSGGTGESTANMQLQSTFTNAGWDFLGESNNGSNEIWKMDAPCYVNDGYPIFAWQNLAIDSVKSSSICDTGSVNLNAFGSFGNLYWYDQASGGNLLDSSFSFHTPIISTTTPYYAVMQYNGCMSAVESVNAIVNTIPNVFAGLNQTVCLGDSIMLSGSGASNYEWSSGIIDNDFFIPASGVNDYYVTGTDINGCSNTDTVSVTVNSYPTITLSILNNDTTLQANDNLATYQWLDCNNSMTPILGENGQSFNPGVNGNYAVELSLNGCVDTSICTTIAAIGISENFAEDWFKVYPSVTTGPFTIQFDKIQEFTTAKIYSITGQLIDEKKIQNEKKIQVELNQSSGVYYIEINDSKNRKSISKIIKQ